MQTITFEAWCADVKAFGGVDLPAFTDRALRRMYDIGCAPEMIRAMANDPGERGQSIGELDALHSELQGINARRNKGP